MGWITIAGMELREENFREIRRMIGFMPDFPPVYDELRVWEFMDFYAAAYGLGRFSRKSRYITELERVELIEKKDAFINELSRGMKQRLTLAKTLLHDPHIILLDEPASGLDPLARKHLYDILKELGASGRTIMISSHILSEMKDFCTAVGIMEAGRFVVSRAIDTLAGGDSLRIHIRLAAAAAGVETRMHGFNGIAEVKPLSEGSYEVRLAGNDGTAAAYLSYLVREGLEVTEYTHTRATIEEVFLNSGVKHVS